MTPEQKKQDEEEQNVHLANKETERMTKTAVKEQDTNKHVESFCFELQKVLQTPYGEIGDLHYYSKFTVYNFTCFKMATIALFRTKQSQKVELVRLPVISTV